jgi:hypothetical protein
MPMQKAIFSVFLSVICLTAFSQIQLDEGAGYSLKDRGYLGIGVGGLGFGQSNAGTYYSIGLTPQAGYMINQYVSSGFAFEYQYTGYPDIHRNITQYGWYPYVRFNIKKFFVQSDYDWYSIPAFNSGERKIFNRFLLGAGYFSQGRGRGGVNFLISYDLLYTANSPFNSPLSIRFFFTF